MLWDQSYTIVLDINIPVTYLNLARKEVQFYWLFSFLKRVETQTLQKNSTTFHKHLENIITGTQNFMIMTER